MTKSPWDVFFPLSLCNPSFRGKHVASTRPMLESLVDGHTQRIPATLTYCLRQGPEKGSMVSSAPGRDERSQWTGHWYIPKTHLGFASLQEGRGTEWRCGSSTRAFWNHPRFTPRPAEQLQPSTRVRARRVLCGLIRRSDKEDVEWGQQNVGTPHEHSQSRFDGYILD